jgi:16S rRNA (guanine966-N2)-methyltransferase
VLDLFAGSGGLGIEALSRGATFAEFVEQDREAARMLVSNLRSTSLDDRARVHQAPVSVALRSVSAPVDVVFVDPPYADQPALAAALEGLARPDLLRETSVVVVEQPWEAAPPEQIGALRLASTRRHGRTRLSVLS